MTRELYPWGRENAQVLSATTWAFRKIPEEINTFDSMSREDQLAMIYAKTGINTGRTPPTEKEIKQKIDGWQVTGCQFAQEEKIEDSVTGDEFLVTIKSC